MPAFRTESIVEVSEGVNSLFVRCWVRRERLRAWSAIAWCFLLIARPYQS